MLEVIHEFLDRLSQGDVEAGFLKIYLPCAGGYLRRLYQLVDKVRELLSVALEHARVFAALRLGQILTLEQLRKAGYRGQRSFDIVRDVGQQLGLELLGL